MGGFKPLLDIGGKPALIRLLNSISSAGLSRITVVTGHGREKIEAALETKGDEPSVLLSPTLRTEGSSPFVLYNENYESGMFSSIQAGIKKATGTDAALLFPVDVPLVAADTIKDLIAAWEKSDISRFAVPFFEGKNGHPLLIPGAYYSAILEYTGDGGLKEIRNRHIAEMIRYETDDMGCVLDMDTPEDYNELLSYYRRSTDE